MSQTTPMDVEVIIADALDAVLRILDRALLDRALLDRAQAGSEVRVIRTEATRLKRAVDDWKVRRPDRDQLLATRQLLGQLSERAQRAARPSLGVALDPHQRPTMPEIPAARAVALHR